MTNLTTHPSAQSTRHSNAQNINTCPESISQEVEILPDSPIARRASGIRLPHDESPKDLDDLEELLKVDVNPDNPDTLLTNVITLIDTIFPDSKLPFLPSEELLNKLPCYNGHCQTWITPDLKERKQREVMLADFLNKVVADLEAITGRSALRNWDASFCNSPLLGSPIVRKPDVVLLDADRRHPVRWASVRAIAEITTQSREPKTISNTVTDKSYVILTTQPNRVFVPILSFWNDWQCRLTVTDRQGQLRSQVFELGTPWHAASCCQFLRLIIGFCFADKVVVGYDPTMKTDAKDKVEFISCDGKEFKVIKVLFEAQSLIGRATHVWLVEYEGRKYILKDAWVENSRPISEFTCLESLKGVQGVAQLFCGADVCVNGETLHTGLIRAGGWGNKKKFRVRRRIVLSTIGEHIATFSSKKELISAFRDITKSM
jgi:hypothetical protein